MSYREWLVDADFLIPTRHLGAVFEAMEEAESSHLAENAVDVADLFEKLGFSVEHTEEGVRLVGYEAVAQIPDRVLGATAEYVQDGSYLVWLGDDGAKTRTVVRAGDRENALVHAVERGSLRGRHIGDMNQGRRGLGHLPVRDLLNQYGPSPGHVLGVRPVRMLDPTTFYRRRVWYAHHVPDWDTCPACGYPVHDRGNFDICQVCWWEDDGELTATLDDVSGPNHITLREARHNFDEWGHCDGPDLGPNDCVPDHELARDKPRLGRKRPAVDAFDAMRAARSEREAQALFREAVRSLQRPYATGWSRGQAPEPSVPRVLLDRRYEVGFQVEAIPFHRDLVDVVTVYVDGLLLQDHMHAVESADESPPGETPAAVAEDATGLALPELVVRPGLHFFGHGTPGQEERRDTLDVLQAGRESPLAGRVRVRIEVRRDAVIWHGMHTEYNDEEFRLDRLGPFTFDRDRYEQALQQADRQVDNAVRDRVERYRELQRRMQR